MKTTAERLREVMEERNLRQVDVVELCQPYCRRFNAKLQKNDLSQYVSGKVIPSSYKLTILGLALDVSESWLMGFDVPKERNKETSPTNVVVSEDERFLIDLYRSIPEDKKEIALQMIRVALQYKN